MDSWWLALAVLSIICGVAGLFGNGLTLIAIFKFPALRNAVGYFILSLTMNDIIGSAVVIPMHVPMFFSDGKWPLGLVMCRIAKVFSFGCFTTSGITIALISINRCVRITASIEFYTKMYSKKLIAIQIALNWLFPFLLMTLMSLGVGGDIFVRHDDGICQMQGRAGWYLLIAVYPTVLITIIVCYSKIYCFAERSGRNLSRTRSNQSYHSNRNTASRRLLKMLFATTIMFVICFTPGPVIGTFTGKGNLKASTQSIVGFFYNAPYYISLFLNPIIYGALNYQYRNAYHKILCGMLRIGVSSRTMSAATSSAIGSTPSTVT